MKDHPLYSLACKLRPEIATLDNQRAFQAFVEVFTVLYLLPFAFIALIWLFAVSDFELNSDNVTGFSTLFISLLIIQSRPATIPLRLSSNSSTQITISLGSIIVWVGLFIWGPVALIFDFVVNLILRIRDAWRRSRFVPNAGWLFLSYLMQDLTNTTLANLVGITLYLALAQPPALPLASVQLVDWIPAFVAIIVSSLLPAILMMPVIIQINRLANIPNTFASLWAFALTVMRVLLLTTPFAIPFTLLYTNAGPAVNLFATIGLVLVNLLLYYLSRANQRSQQRTREMTQLEALGEEIIQAPADGSTLMEILPRYIEAMFPDPLDILEIRIFEDVDLPGFEGGARSLHWVHPLHQSPSPDSYWDDLRKSKEPHIIFRDVIPAGSKAVYGDAILDKITSAEPTTNGEAPACIGGVYLLRNKAVAQSIDSLPAVQALASQVASALYRAQTYAETLAAHKMAQELAFAGSIQASFLPEEVPAVEGWGIAASLTPARQTAGDFYDFILLGDGKLGILVADVADKGTGAALYMALSRTLIRTYAMDFPAQPAEALRLANERILADTRANQFVTVFYGVLDLNSGEMIYCNAGHNPAFILSAADPDAHTAYIRTGAPLGIFGDLQWEQGCAQVAAGDALLLYTDGVVEAQNMAEEFYEYDRLLAIGKTNLSKSAQELHTAILSDVKTFVGDAPQFDDITLMVLKREAL